jgi:hypothetical protein
VNLIEDKKEEIAPNESLLDNMATAIQTDSPLGDSRALSPTRKSKSIVNYKDLNGRGFNQ